MPHGTGKARPAGPTWRDIACFLGVHNHVAQSMYSAASSVEGDYHASTESLFNHGSGGFPHVRHHLMEVKHTGNIVPGTDGSCALFRTDH